MRSYPDIADASHATPELERRMRSYFTAKTGQQVAATMGHFSRSQLVYSDAVLGWIMDYDGVHDVYADFMPRWGEGLSYPTRLVGDERSAVIFAVSTPELFGQEALAIVAADFSEAGEIVRWVDYWDGRHFGVDAVRQLEAARPRADGEPFPASFGEERVEGVASERIRDVVGQLTSALARSDAGRAAGLFVRDCVLEDMTLRSQIRGRLAVERYLHRALAALPYGADMAVRHVLGSDQGGGFEWTRGEALRGITCIELDDCGAITRMTSVWDGALVPDDAFTALALHTYEPFATAGHAP